MEPLSQNACSSSVSMVKHSPCFMSETSSVNIHDLPGFNSNENSTADLCAPDETQTQFLKAGLDAVFLFLNAFKTINQSAWRGAALSCINAEELHALYPALIQLLRNLQTAYFNSTASSGTKLDCKNMIENLIQSTHANTACNVIQQLYNFDKEQLLTNTVDKNVVDIRANSPFKNASPLSQICSPLMTISSHSSSTPISPKGPSIKNCNSNAYNSSLQLPSPLPPASIISHLEKNSTAALQVLNASASLSVKSDSHSSPRDDARRGTPVLNTHNDSSSIGESARFGEVPHIFTDTPRSVFINSKLSNVVNKPALNLNSQCPVYQNTVMIVYEMSLNEASTFLFDHESTSDDMEPFRLDCSKDDTHKNTSGQSEQVVNHFHPLRNASPIFGESLNKENNIPESISASSHSSGRIPGSPRPLRAQPFHQMNVSPSTTVNAEAWEREFESGNGDLYRMKRRRKRLEAIQKNQNLKFPPSDSTLYPLVSVTAEYAANENKGNQHDYRRSIQNSRTSDSNTKSLAVLDSFSLQIIFERFRTGYNAYDEDNLPADFVIGGRYLIVQRLDEAVFSTAFHCKDLLNDRDVCVKVIKNDKNYFDQSLDELKLLRYININGDSDKLNFLKLYDYFYYREHLTIVTELLNKNLYAFSQEKSEKNQKSYFTLGRLQKVAKQILIAIQYIHSLFLIHCDLKPENILMRDEAQSTVKVIDFGSSCFVDDILNSYVQSRSYRAPEVILGLPYNESVDIWSVGCILAELWTGFVLFQNNTIQSLLASMLSILGPIPKHMTARSKTYGDYFTKNHYVYAMPKDDADGASDRIQIIVPRQYSLKQRLNVQDTVFLDFISSFLQFDPCQRTTATQALHHDWLQPDRYPDGIRSE